MTQRDRTAQIPQREVDHQRWADDGGPSPEAELPTPAVEVRSPWLAVIAAAAAGFAIGWLTMPPRRER